MGPFPFIGRLHLVEYLYLLLSLCLIGTELVLRLITLALPAPVIRIGYAISASLFSRFSSGKAEEMDEMEGGQDDEDGSLFGDFSWPPAATGSGFRTAAADLFDRFPHLPVFGDQTDDSGPSGTGDGSAGRGTDSGSNAAQYRNYQRMYRSKTFLERSKVQAIRNATDFEELCQIFGYETEEHLVQTQDGYILGIHRLCWTRSECKARISKKRAAAAAAASSTYTRHPTSRTGRGGDGFSDGTASPGRADDTPEELAFSSVQPDFNIDDVDDGDDGLRPVNAGLNSVKKKVVYLHHGLLMSSDVWVCLTDQERCLPFHLVEKGYDVWLGNNRGNKYGKKSFRHSLSDHRFWAFSIDEFAFYDIPDSINYILDSTGQPSLSYIGFSQGSAQAFASLSVHPDLNGKIDVFIALAPALAVPGLTSSVLNSLVQASPHVLFLAFGRRSVLGSTKMWQALLYPPMFVKLIDWSIGLLFGWKAENISPEQKLAAYAHVYDHSSTRSIVHWFQIMRSGTFQMFDDDLVPTRLGGWFALAASLLRAAPATKFSRPTKYPTRNIRTPITLIYGGVDGLVEAGSMLRELPPNTVSIKVPHYEHLDFLWARDVDKTVFPHVTRTLERYSGTAGMNLDEGNVKGGPEGQQQQQLALTASTDTPGARAGSNTTGFEGRGGGGRGVAGQVGVRRGPRRMVVHREDVA